MNVSQLIDRTLQFALDEDDATTNLREKVLEDINQAYKYVLGRIANRNLDWNVDTVVLSNVTAQDDLPANIKLYSVYDITNGRKLIARTLAQLEEQFPTMTDTSAARYYYLSDNASKINLMPIGSTGISIRVRYYAAPNELVDGGAESTIKLPPMHDEVLVSGAKWFMAQRENGFHDQAIVDRRFMEFDERTRELLRNVKSITPVQDTVTGYYF